MKNNVKSLAYNKTEFGYDLNKDFVEKEFEIQIARKITASTIEDIIVTALEGGTDYWMGIDNTTWNKPEGMPISQYATELILTGESIKFYDIEEGEDDTDWILNLDRLLKGIALNEEKRPIDADVERLDAEMADCIFQYALFGDVLYG